MSMVLVTDTIILTSRSGSALGATTDSYQIINRTIGTDQIKL